MPAPRFVLDDFWPSDLFLGGIPGAWYDPTDLSTMFQDSTGTTPVTAVEQPVGLILDKSQGLALGSELVANGTFNSGITGWNNFQPARGTVSWNAAAQRLRVDNTTGTGDAYVWTNTAVTAGKTYKIEYNYYKIAGASGSAEAKLYWFNGVAAVGTISQIATISNNLASFLLTAPAGATSILIGSDVTQIWEIDNVSVRELAGNHASQSTAASRPTYRARYNLLTYSEQFDTAGIWIRDAGGTGIAPTVTANAGVAPDGTTTADRIQFDRGAGAGSFSRIRQTAATVASTPCTWSVWMRTFSGTGTQTVGLRADTTGVSCTVTGTWQRFQVTATSTAAVCEILSWTGLTSDQTMDVLAWGAQLLTAADVTATGNAYQRIAAATVYDTAPIFRPYLAFDGLDDSLSTAAINFTSTDKMTVFAGASKLSDAASGNLVELSANKNLNAGTFYIWFPELSPTGDITWVTRGTVNTSGFARVAIAAPVTAVVTGTGDIPGDTATIRINNLSNTTTADQGAGPFGTYPLFIGRRGGVSQPFNGRLYSLIVRGAASSVTEIADTELWVNARTGGY